MNVINLPKLTKITGFLGRKITENRENLKSDKVGRLDKNTVLRNRYIESRSITSEIGISIRQITSQKSSVNCLISRKRAVTESACVLLITLISQFQNEIDRLWFLKWTILEFFH